MINDKTNHPIHAIRICRIRAFIKVPSRPSIMYARAIRARGRDTFTTHGQIIIINTLGENSRLMKRAQSATTTTTNRDHLTP